MQVDVHQHIWTDSLLHALETRDQLPFVRRSAELTLLYSAGEQAYAIDCGSEAPDGPH